MPMQAKRTAAGHTPQSSMLSLLSGWVQQGVESVFATQRILVDLAVRQSGNAMKALKERLSDPEYSLAPIVTELAVEGTANFIEAQRILLNLVQEQSGIVTNGVKERVGASATAVAMADLLRRSIDIFVEAQQEFLTVVNKQSQKWRQPGKTVEAACLTEVAREAMDNFVAAQKKFLDVIADETEKATSGKHSKAAKAPTEISKLVRDSANSFIDAQKKLLDVAGQQMNVNLHAAGKAMKALSPSHLLPIGSITGEGVKDFVSAQKAVMDTVLKPRNGAKRAAKPKVPAKRKVAANVQTAAIA